MKTSSATLDEILTRGVGEFIDPDERLRTKLTENPKNVVIKFGVDPTRPDIHLGHAVVLRKLRQFQDLGAKVIFLIGDFTSLIGDPSGKSKVRPQLSQKEIEANMKTYLDQVGKILITDEGVFSWIRNSDWFLNISDLIVSEPVTYTDNATKASVTFPPNSFFAKTAVYDATRMQKTHLKKNEIHDVTVRTLLSTLRHITHSRLIGRDMFQDRLKAGGELYLHEMLYPVLQGIDSSILARLYGSCDVEIGGTDQTFNMLMGRDIMKAAGQEPQSVLALDLLEGLDGKEKMSKSADNYIGITETPNDMYGKLMSLPDAIITKYFRLCTYTPLPDIEDIEKRLAVGKENPRDVKMRLAREIVEIYHGREAAEKAENHFTSVFSKGEVPIDVPETRAPRGAKLAEVLIESKIVSSRTDFRRLIDAGAIETLEGGEAVASYDFTLTATIVLRIGKKRFLKIIVGE